MSSKNRSDKKMIQWFPGHMAKARREIEENLKLVDVVIELLDARAPNASKNPMLQDIIKNKEKIVLLMKNDLADSERTKEWVKYFDEKEILSLPVNVNNKQDISKVIELVSKKGMELQQKRL